MPAAGSSLRRLRWIVWGAALAIGILAGVVIALVHSRGSGEPSAGLALSLPTGPDTTWAAGAKRAPDFRLTDAAGKPVSLARFHGRPVILTFIDPLCRNLCPREARVLDSVETRLPAAQRPAIVAVSVNQWANARRNLLTDNRKWKLGKAWHWAVGAPASLARVWRNYGIGVTDNPKTITGVTVHDITHTEASYVIDPSGHVRALYLYPFQAADVARTVQQLVRAQS